CALSLHIEWHQHGLRRYLRTIEQLQMRCRRSWDLEHDGTSVRALRGHRAVEVIRTVGLVREDIALRTRQLEKAGLVHNWLVAGIFYRQCQRNQAGIPIGSVLLAHAIKYQCAILQRHLLAMCATTRNWRWRCHDYGAGPWRSLH